MDAPDRISPAWGAGGNPFAVKRRCPRPRALEPDDAVAPTLPLLAPHRVPRSTRSPTTTTAPFGLNRFLPIRSIVANQTKYLF